MLRSWWPAPLVRAIRLEEALGSPTRIHSTPTRIHSTPTRIHSTPTRIHSTPTRIHYKDEPVASGPAQAEHRGPTGV